MFTCLERNDSLEAETLQQTGIDLIRGDARVLKPGRDSHRRPGPATPLVSLSRPAHNHILRRSPDWPRPVTGPTARRLATRLFPQHVLVVGGEAQAIELAEMFRLYGSEVTLVTHANRLVSP